MSSKEQPRQGTQKWWNREMEELAKNDAASLFREIKPHNKQIAREMRELYLSLLEEDFDEQQALYVIATMWKLD